MRVSKDFYDKVECASIFAEAGFFGSAVSSAAARILLPSKLGKIVGSAASVSSVAFWGFRAATSHAIGHLEPVPGLEALGESSELTTTDQIE